MLSAVAPHFLPVFRFRQVSIAVSHSLIVAAGGSSLL